MYLKHEQLRQIREKAGLTQTDIAKMLEMSLRQYQRYERGEYRLPIPYCYYLSAKLGGPKK